MLHYIKRYILAMRIFGFKIGRLLEFSKVLAVEIGVAGWPRRMWLLGKILTTLARAVKIGGRSYRKRMMACSRCVIYNPATKQCGSSEEGKAGCGCYMPFKAAIARTPEEGCWFHEFHGHEKWSE